MDVIPHLGREIKVVITDFRTSIRCSISEMPGYDLSSVIDVGVDMRVIEPQTTHGSEASGAQTVSYVVTLTWVPG